MTAGQTVYVMIGAGGISNRGGWNGGGKGRDNDNGTGGGGRTDIRLSGDTVGSSNYLIGWNTDILTAGGGGGAKRSSSGRPAMGFVDSNTTGLNGTSHASDIGGAGHYGGKAFYGGSSYYDPAYVRNATVEIPTNKSQWESFTNWLKPGSIGAIIELSERD